MPYKTFETTKFPEKVTCHDIREDKYFLGRFLMTKQASNVSLKRRENHFRHLQTIGNFRSLVASGKVLWPKNYAFKTV